MAFMHNGMLPGVAYGSEFRVNTYTAGDQSVSQQLQLLLTVGMQITWYSYQDGSGSGIYAQTRFSPGVVYRSEFPGKYLYG